LLGKVGKLFLRVLDGGGGSGGGGGGGGGFGCANVRDTFSPKGNT